MESPTRGKTNDALRWATVLVALLKSRTKDILILTNILIVLQKVGIKIH